MDKLYFRVAACGVALGLGLSTSARAQLRSAPYFQDDATAARSALGAALLHSRPLTLNAAGLQAALATAPPETRPGAAPLTLALPLPDGSTGRFAVTETAVMVPALAAQFPQIKTYRGVGLDDPSATVRLDLTPQGFHAQILSETTGTVYIDPASRGDRQHVLSFYRRDMNRAAAGPVPACGFQPTAAEQAETRRLAATAGSAQRTLIASGPTLRAYRLAVAATGEYTQFQGGTVALAQAAIVTTINRVVGVYERELAVRLVLVANNSSLIYTSTGSDPYTNGNDVAMISENQTNVDAIIGSSNYDIGHVFGTNSGGRAGLRVVCVAGNKARGITGSGAPVGDAFDIDYVAHEMGHQFGGNHTFNSVANGCNGNRTGSRAYEPGSGSTIMSYAGLCSPDNLQNNSDAYFHTANFEEMATFIASTGCAASTATGNTAPVVTVPAARTLPIGTPFRLTATATDAEGDALTYNWEEMDLGAAGSLADPQVANDNEPLFRSFTATNSPTRYFPRLATVISNTSSLFERLPTVTRTLTFRCTARDQHNGSAGVVGGVNYSANLVLPVTSAAGPFLVTAPNTAVTWAGNSTQTVTWNVAGTTANGVNCATVNILLSTDGGLTYPTTLASGVANDGSQTITVPNTNTTTARVMVAAADNYFFDISNANFTINAGAACDAPTNLAVASLTGSSASISFAPSGTASGYTVTTTPASTSQTVTASPVTLTGLTAATNYTVNIVSNCAGGVTSAPATLSFATRVANDECATAVGLTSGAACTTTSGTVTGATQSQAASTCDNSLSTSALDVWYSFVATGPTHTVTTNSAFDGVLQVYAGGCGSLTSLGCRDVNSSGGESLTLNGLTNGARYYVRYYPYVTASIPAPADGSFTICVSGPAGPTAAPVLLTPANNSVTSNNRPPITGTAPAGTTVTVYIDGTSSGSTTANASGNWSVTPVTSLADGLRAAYATAAAGLNVSANSNTNNFTVDTTPPPAPVVAAPINGRRININRPFYGGTGEANTTLTVLVDGSSVGTTTVASDGTWGLTQPTALANGSHTVKARATDGAGNTSPDSNTNTFIVDTAAPTLTYFTSTEGASGSTVNTTPFTFEVGFSEQVTGFTASDVIVTNGTIASSNFFPITNSQYAFTVTPAAAGVVTTVQIPAGAAQDFAGNDNVASAVYSLTYVAPVTATAWTGSVSPDWYTAGNWSAGVPTVSLNASIPANTPFAPVISSGAAQTLSLTISTGAGLTMSGGSLDVRGDLINDGTFLPTGGTVFMGGGAARSNIFGSSRVRFWNLNPIGQGVRLSTPAGASVRRLLTLTGGVITDDNGFVLESDATGTALTVSNGGTIFGRTTVQRYISPDLNPGLGYRHLASPVDGATVGGLATGAFTPVINPAYNTSPTPNLVTPFPNVFAYDQSRLSSTANNLPAFDKGWVSPSALSDWPGLLGGYTVNVAAGQTLSFTGTFTFTTGTLSRSFSRNNDATAPDAGWHLVGNPFPAPLDYSRVSVADRAGLDAAIYVYESTSQYGGNYRSYVNGFGNPILPMAQAFFVRVSSPQTNGTLTMRHSYRVTSYQDPVYHRPTTDTRPVVRLALKPVGGTLTDDAYVYFEQGATDGFDAQYDAEKLPNPSGLNLSTSLSATQRLSIDGRGLLGTAQKVVPLAVGVPATGTYTLTAAELLNLSTVPTYLRDLQTGALIDLAQQPSYQFTVSNASALITGRFELVFSPQRPMAAASAAQALQLSVWPNPARGQAELNLTLSKAVPNATATLRDVVGRTVATRSFSGTATNLPTRGLATGTYLLSVTAPGQATVTRRVVVE